ncbi:DUF4372 domain-containing protein [Sporocytophaga myxococcoides]|uniref:DUF4372 domain-containing protein n=1 Tax=Sporocytophaga myxococcoides TaxID=153721 RepID=UPI00351CA748
MLYGVFSYCNGLREICEGMLACKGKLLHLGLDKAPARSIGGQISILERINIQYPKFNILKLGGD